MPAFDIVSEYDSHEASNAVDQANREIDTRFDFRGSNATFSLDEKNILMESDNRSEERRVGKECRSRWSPNQ